MGLITTFLAVAFAVAVTLFAVSNREPVTVELWPLPYSVTVGLYAAILFGVLVGFLVGAIATWLAGGRRRRAFRETKRQLREAEKSLALAKQDAAAAEARAALVPGSSNV